MPRSLARQNTTKVKRKMISCGMQVYAGPETAARLGVPVGSLVETREVRKYSNPFKQLMWWLRNPYSGKIIERS